MKDKTDLISIIVPCYNVEKYIKKCITSIKKQTYQNLEIIIIDDGSSDKTKEIIKKEIKDNKKFKYFYQKNKGQGSARNYGLTKATGLYVCFIDADDYVDKNYIKELHNTIINNNVNIAICNIERIYSTRQNSINNITNTKINMALFPGPCNKMFKTSLFSEYNIYFLEGKYYEDLNLTTKLLILKNVSYTIINKPLYKYFQHNNSTMHPTKNNQQKIFDIFPIVEDIENFAKKENVYNQKHLNLEFINIYHILIGTIYRSSFKENFDSTTIKKIYTYVTNKYPNWFKNKYIKELPIIYQLYLLTLKLNLFYIVYIVLKIFNKKIYL